MAWRIGIDEAGYGPNLGPLVMTAVACQVPDELCEADLWEAFASAVRRKRAKDRRLFVEDSKQVYSGPRGLCDLETAVLAVLAVAAAEEENPFARLQSLTHALEQLCPETHGELTRETWFTGTTGLPVAAEKETLHDGLAGLLTALRERGVRWGPMRCMVCCPGRFNDLVDQWGSKGAVLAVGLHELLRWHLERAATEAVYVVVDKHGGRNHYSALVQEAVSPGMVVAREEGMARSVYDVIGLDRSVRMTFMPRADGSDFCVALASMISKYLRELFMTEFNAFWQKHVPGLEPTAGYPGDSTRFYADIARARAQLGLADRVLWRER